MSETHRDRTTEFIAAQQPYIPSQDWRSQDLPFQDLPPNPSQDASQDRAPASLRHDLAGLVDEIRGIVAESERRQAALMQDMHERIDELATKTGKSGAEIPADYRGAFAQIEKSMAQLATRIAGTARAPHNAAASAPANAVGETAGARPQAASNADEPWNEAAAEQLTLEATGYWKDHSVE